MKWTFRILVLAFIVAFLHYTLPHHSIVRIVGTENKRVNVGWNIIFYDGRMRNAQGDLVGTDIWFINTVRPNGKSLVFRNEDTNWWPPYLKFNSADLQTEATDLVSTADSPRWVAVTYYGWRSNLMSIYPNAVRLREVDSPDQRIIPWFNIVFIIVLIALARAIQVRVRRWWNRRFGSEA
ncbi:MAG: DUF1523 family protein [Pseudomonadota bacterium]